MHFYYSKEGVGDETLKNFHQHCILVIRMGLCAAWRDYLKQNWEANCVYKRWHDFPNGLFTHMFCWAWLERTTFQKGQIWLKLKAFPAHRYLSKGFALNFLNGNTVVFYSASARTSSVEDKNTNCVLDCFVLQPLELLDLCLQLWKRYCNMIVWQ